MQLWSDFQATALRVFDEVNPVGQVPIILWSSHLTQPEVIDSFLDKSRLELAYWYIHNACQRQNQLNIFTIDAIFV